MVQICPYLAIFRSYLGIFRVFGTSEGPILGVVGFGTPEGSDLRVLGRVLRPWVLGSWVPGWVPPYRASPPGMLHSAFWHIPGITWALASPLRIAYTGYCYSSPHPVYLRYVLLREYLYTIPGWYASLAPRI